MPTASPKKTAQESATHRIAIAGLWPGARRALHLWHLASLDAPTVALAWAFSFAWAAGTRLPMQAASVIVLGVWTVYVTDRLLDARAAIGSQIGDRLRERHYFHWRHRRILAPLAAIAGTVAAILVFAYIPAVARERDSVLAAASLVYFARVHQNSSSLPRRSRSFLTPIVTKELLVGIIFAAGCALPALGSVWAAPSPMRCAWIATISVFAALAWLNCHAIEQWESDSPDRDARALRACAFLLATIGLVGEILLCPLLTRAGILLAGASLSALLIAGLNRIRTSLSPVTLRAAVDLVLLMPALIVSIAGLAPITLLLPITRLPR